MSLSTPKARLVDAAVGYVRAGWPVVPTSYPTADRLICHRCPPDVDTAREWWSDQLYGIAGHTGELFDALEVPVRLGERVLGSLGGRAPAVIEIPLTGTWLFLVTPRSPLSRDLPPGCGVAMHGRDGWVPLPPTAVLGGEVLWVSRPPFLRSPVLNPGGRTGGADGVGGLDQPGAAAGNGWRLPHSLVAQWAVLHALNAVRRDTMIAQERNGELSH